MKLNVRLNFDVIWYYTLPSKFSGILFSLQPRNPEINSNSWKKLTEIEVEYWKTDLHAKNHLECFLFQVQKMNVYLGFGTVTGKNVWYLLGIIINENNGKSFEVFISSSYRTDQFVFWCIHSSQIIGRQILCSLKSKSSFFSLLIAHVKTLYSESHCSMATNIQMWRTLDV